LLIQHVPHAHFSYRYKACITHWISRALIVMIAAYVTWVPQCSYQYHCQYLL